MSASRAGFSPIASDLFADMDLVALCPTTRVSRYPYDFESIADASPPTPFIYTGGLENYPDLIERIAKNRELFGNSGAILRGVRNPQVVAECLSRQGIPFPELRAEHAVLTGAKWLMKPLQGSGGNRIRFCNEQPDARLQSSGGWFFQQFISGPSYSAVYVGDGSQATMIGLTQQLVGADWLGAKRFAYCGSIGPINVTLKRQLQLEALGDCLVDSFKLLGFFGVDLIIRDDEIWPIEVNPRYTASVEVLELAMSLNAMSLHVASCRKQSISPTLPRATTTPTFGKAICYADADIEMTEQTIDFARRLNNKTNWPVFADLPFPGTFVKKGSPIATAIACGSSDEEVLNELKSLWHSFEATVDRQASILEH